MPDGLYEKDILLWSERQAALLRRLAAGERLNEAVDWANVIDEVETVGRSELFACSSLLRQALIHLAKLSVWPDSPPAAHWRGEVLTFLADARIRYSPSMRQKLDLAELYRQAVRIVQAGADRQEDVRSVATACPFTLDELLDADADIPALVVRLA